ncbi:MAG: hypothetical protein DRJ30_06350 [Candidatus Methanomethylicota archaeon]|nr:MAG: hypothetical protein DRJ30_06350 [Candidatus Verstraetearchaeota archaeon]
MRVKVHRKSLIVIPVEVRRKTRYIYEGSHLDLIVEGDEIRLMFQKS